jgi:hypothetical protein
VFGVRPTAHKPRAAAEKFFSAQQNNGRAATGIDHNVRARIAHLADKSEHDLNPMNSARSGEGPIRC